ncbi:hypothetical protein B0T17DRAFT_504973 [Bombardia bombarda]|uniref:Uncharacterized protein n=1 Tax=Bombardia bombarda TaxID=252184 RepID=A0AA40C7Y2_9PEZI|nr:hypothetical protein B0T17DRAFT_504973 [Bombardia bombarda]
MSTDLRTQSHLSIRLGGDKWRPEEDAKLLELTGKCKASKWPSISAMLPGRTRDGCRRRYRFISKKILNDPNTQEVVRRYIRRKAQMWELIAKDFGGSPWQAVERIYVKIVQERPMLLYYEVQRQKTSTDRGSAQPQKTHTPIALTSVGTPDLYKIATQMSTSDQKQMTGSLVRRHATAVHYCVESTRERLFLNVIVYGCSLPRIRCIIPSASRETLDVGTDVDRNLVDALLLGAKRIGHGFALSWHPYIMKQMKGRGVCLELCPISNQILGLTSRMGGHSMYGLLANNVHCTAMIGKADMTVHGWRQLIEWSLEHACMDEAERVKIFTSWERRWKGWLKWVIEDYSHVLPV